MKKLNEYYKEPDYKDVITEVEDDEFEIGQNYEEIPARKIVCTKCGNDRWIVGTGSYYTALKCPKCLYEICIHEG